MQFAPDHIIGAAKKGIEMSYNGYGSPQPGYFQTEAEEAQYHADIAECEYIEQQEAYAAQAEAEEAAQEAEEQAQTANNSESAPCDCQSHVHSDCLKGKKCFVCGRLLR